MSLVYMLKGQTQIVSKQRTELCSTLKITSFMSRTSVLSQILTPLFFQIRCFDPTEVKGCGF